MIFWLSVGSCWICIKCLSSAFSSLLRDSYKHLRHNEKLCLPESQWCWRYVSSKVVDHLTRVEPSWVDRWSPFHSLSVGPNKVSWLINACDLRGSSDGHSLAPSPSLWDYSTCCSKLQYHLKALWRYNHSVYVSTSSMVLPLWLSRLQWAPATDLPNCSRISPFHCSFTQSQIVHSRSLKPKPKLSSAVLS